MKRLYYFAYGSNILTERIQTRLGSVRKVCNYSLPGYGLIFNCGMFTAFANIVRKEEQSVEGVIWQLTDHQISRLDTYEGWPNNYQKKYFQLPDGELAFAYVCYNPKMFTDKKPTIDYLNKILDGCKEHGLIDTYNLLVHYKNKHYSAKLKKGNRHKLIEL